MENHPRDEDPVPAGEPWVAPFCCSRPRRSPGTTSSPTRRRTGRSTSRSTGRARGPSVTGVPLYDLRTDAPQFLPFTYPPFAAFAALPLLVAPFHAVGLAVDARAARAAVVDGGRRVRPVPRAVRPPRRARAGRVGRRRGVAAAGVGGRALRPGQRRRRRAVPVGRHPARAVAGRRPGAWSGGSGVGVGLATAVKLTPGVFWLHWAVARRWRVLAVSVATAVGVTVATALVLPAAVGVVLVRRAARPRAPRPERRTSNQSLRGLLLRVGPGRGTARPRACGRAGRRRGRGRARAVAPAGPAGDPVAVVAAVGLVAYLVSRCPGCTTCTGAWW
jgi:alpha-1,2-mannosyltransferase